MSSLSNKENIENVLYLFKYPSREYLHGLSDPIRNEREEEEERKRRRRTREKKQTEREEEERKRRRRTKR